MHNPFRRLESKRGTLARVAALLLCLGLWLATMPRLRAQARPSSDPIPLYLLVTLLNHGQTGKAERQMQDNLPVTKTRLEEFLVERDQRFDELGRFGATSGHDVHKEVLDDFMAENRGYSKLFEIYGEQVLKRVSGAWACAADVDTNSGGTVTSITAGTALTATPANPITTSLDPRTLVPCGGDKVAWETSGTLEDGDLSLLRGRKPGRSSKQSRLQIS